jgi:hypothetical protein
MGVAILLAHEKKIHCIAILGSTSPWWWNDDSEGETEVLEEKPVPVTRLHHKSHLDFLGIKFLPLP